MPHPVLGVRQQSPETFSITSTISLDSLLDQTGQHRILASQLEDQAACLVKGAWFRRPRDQSRRHSSLLCCGFWHIELALMVDVRSEDTLIPMSPGARQMRHAGGRKFGDLASTEPRPSLDRLRAGHVTAAMCRNLGSLSPTGRRCCRPYPTSPIKSRFLPGLLQRVCLAFAVWQVPPVPRNCRCAPDAPRYNAARSIRFVARKRHTQRGGSSGPPFSLC